MPRSDRGRYTVVTYTVAMLCLLGGVTKAIQPLLPPPPENRMARETGDFLRQGGYMPVQWIPWGPEVFEEARRLKRPVFLLIGATYSAPGRHADRVIFQDTDVAAYLSAYFVCSRIDIQVHPYARFAYVPLQRTRQTTDPACQVVFLDEQGRYLQHIVGFGVTSIPTPTSILDQLTAARRTFDQSKDMPFSESPWSRQIADKELLTQGAIALGEPDFKRQDQEIQSRAAAGGGNLSRFGVSSLWPNVYRYLHQTRRRHDLDVLLNPILESAHVDWLDGGFYRRVRLEPPYRIDYDKLATMNAEMMALLAEVNPESSNPLRSRIARDTFDFLAGEMVSEGIVQVAQLGDEMPGGRSKRHSFPLRDLVNNFSPFEVNEIQSLMMLNPGENPLMTPRPRSAEALASEKFNSYLDKLRGLRPTKPRFGTSYRIEAPASVTARLIRTASIWGDADRLAIAQRLRANLLPFIFGSDVASTLSPGFSQESSLGDNLAVAQMEFEAFLATGDIYALERAAAVLARAVFLFQGSAPGVINPTQTTNLFPEFRGAVLPEVTDDFQASDMATLLQLSASISRLGSRSTNSEFASHCRSLAQIATLVQSAYAEASYELAFEGSAYFSAALVAIMPVHILVVGPDATATAREIRIRLPGVIAVPARPTLDRLLGQTKPGCYVVRGTMLSGPKAKEAAIFEADEAWIQMLNERL